MKNMASGVVNSLNSIYISFKTNEIISGKIKGLSFGCKYKGQWLASYCLLLMKLTGDFHYVHYVSGSHWRRLKSEVVSNVFWTKITMS